MNESPLALMARWEDVEKNRLHLIGTPDTKLLTESIAEKIQKLLDLAHSKNPQFYAKRDVLVQSLDEYRFFWSGEPNVTLPWSVRWNHVWAVSDPHGDANAGEISINDKYQHDKLLLSAIRNNGARTTNLIMPCLYGARQDKTTPKRRQPITVNQTGAELDAIIWRDGYMYILDLHNPTSEFSFSEWNVMNFYTWWLVRRAIESLGIPEEDIRLLPADEGGIKKVEAIAKDIWVDSIKVTKARNYDEGGIIRNIQISGNPEDVKWKHLIIHDDILDSWWTLCKLLEELLAMEPASISVVITHGMFNGQAKQKLSDVIIKSEWKIKKVFISDSINKVNLPDYVEVIPSGQLFANAISNPQSVNRDDDTDYTSIND